MSQNTTTSTTIDDQSLNITYSGSGTSWNRRIYPNDTGTLSFKQNATATLEFFGTAVEYWGTHNSDHGSCLLTLDGTIVGTINSWAQTLGPSTSLYSNNSLEYGNHTLVIAVLNAVAPNGCEIDRFVVNATNPEYINPASYSGPRVIAIWVGVGITFVVTVWILTFAWWLWFKRAKRRRRAKRNEESDIEDEYEDDVEGGAEEAELTPVSYMGPVNHIRGSYPPVVAPLIATPAPALTQDRLAPPPLERHRGDTRPRLEVRNSTSLIAIVNELFPPESKSHSPPISPVSRDS